MANYTYPTTPNGSGDWGIKDGLDNGSALKRLTSVEFDTEFKRIATAVNSKADSENPTFTGTMAGAFTINGGTY